MTRWYDQSDDAGGSNAGGPVVAVGDGNNRCLWLIFSQSAAESDVATAAAIGVAFGYEPIFQQISGQRVLILDALVTC